MPLQLTNCNVVELETGSILEDVSIVIEGDRISNIAKHRDLQISKTLDLKGAFVLPSLVNVHNNLSHTYPIDVNENPAATVLRCYRRAYDGLLSGVTTIRTVGEVHRVDFILRDQINKGTIVGPRILAGGKALSVTSNLGIHEGHVLADGADEFTKAARQEISLGADHLKVYATGGITGDFRTPQMTVAEMKAVVSVAKSHNTYVAAHAGGSDAIILAAEAGVLSIEHAYDLNNEAITAMKQNECYLVPTLGVTRSPMWMKEHHFPAAVIERATFFGNMHLESIRKAVRAGVKVVNGTDIPPGDKNNGINVSIKEMQYLVEAGLSNLQAIRASTSEAAALCRLNDAIGEVKIGYYADLIAVKGNPLTDLKNMEHIELVIKSGEVLRNTYA
ncbi:MAG: amidohydrolase family protein [Nitrososphaerota archaeon]|nr:amidohydrolase family protein [Nitrososphaerota archaeon]